MEKEELVKMFNEGVSAEEIPVMSYLEELKDLIENSNLEKSIKEKMKENTKRLINDTIRHSKIFTELIRGVQK